MHSFGSSRRILKAILRRLVCWVKGHDWVQSGTRLAAVTEWHWNAFHQDLDSDSYNVEVTRFACSRCPKEQYSGPASHKRERSIGMRLGCSFKGHDWTDWVVKGAPTTIVRWNEADHKYDYIPGIRYLRTRECQRAKCDVTQRVTDKHTIAL